MTSSTFSELVNEILALFYWLELEVLKVRQIKLVLLIRGGNLLYVLGYTCHGGMNFYYMATIVRVL